jgi:hypothetical protein
MTNVWHFLVTHQTIVALVAMWLFSNVVTALPSPTNDSATFYKFFFAFAHGLAGSLPRVFPSARVFADPTQGSATYFAKPAATPTPDPPRVLP